MMATKTVTICCCDVCGKPIDRPYSGGERGTYRLSADADYAIAGEALNWQELCMECNSWLGGMFEDLKHYSKSLKENQ